MTYKKLRTYKIYVHKNDTNIDEKTERLTKDKKQQKHRLARALTSLFDKAQRLPKQRFFTKWMYIPKNPSTKGVVMTSCDLLLNFKKCRYLRSEEAGGGCRQLVLERFTGRA